MICQLRVLIILLVKKYVKDSHSIQGEIKELVVWLAVLCHNAKILFNIEHEVANKLSDFHLFLQAC